MVLTQQFLFASFWTITMNEVSPVLQQNAIAVIPVGVWGRYRLCRPAVELILNLCRPDSSTTDSASANSSKVSYTHRFKMQFISMMAKLNFQQPLLESSGSHDPWEIILICGFLLKKHYSFLITKIILLLFKKLIIISVKNGWKYYLHFFVATVFSQDSIMTRKFKWTSLIWNRNIM